MINIGYACQIEGYREYPIRTCRLASATREVLNQITRENLQVLHSMLKYNVKNNIRLFRISSDIIPLGSHPDWSNNQKKQFPWWQDVADCLSTIGDFIIQNDLRVSMHPGQYTVLNSPDQSVVDRAILDLQYHTRFLDELGLPPSHKIILHVGGAYGDKEAALDCFIERAKQLPENILQRLVIENDDKQFHVGHILKVCYALSLPAVFDTLHFTCNRVSIEREDWSKYIQLCGETWKPADGRQKIHYSQQRRNGKLGAHSQSIAVEDWLCDSLRFQNLDVMLEVKDKNLSAIKCRMISNGTSRQELEQTWGRYKYLVMRHSQKHYELLRQMFRANVEPVTFFATVDEALEMPVTEQTLTNAAQHIWGYFKDKQPSTQFLSLLEQFHNGRRSADAVLSYLYRLACKYNEQYLLDGYSFYQKKE